MSEDPAPHFWTQRSAGFSYQFYLCVPQVWLCWPWFNSNLRTLGLIYSEIKMPMLALGHQLTRWNNARITWSALLSRIPESPPCQMKLQGDDQPTLGATPLLLRCNTKITNEKSVVK